MTNAYLILRKCKSRWLQSSAARGFRSYEGLLTTRQFIKSEIINNPGDIYFFAHFGPWFVAPVQFEEFVQLPLFVEFTQELFEQSPVLIEYTAPDPPLIEPNPPVIWPSPVLEILETMSFIDFDINKNLKVLIFQFDLHNITSGRIWTFALICCVTTARWICTRPVSALTGEIVLAFVVYGIQSSKSAPDWTKSSAHSAIWWDFNSFY